MDLSKALTLLALLMIGVLLINGLELDHEDRVDSPLHEFYMENYDEAGSINLVENILLNYRAYDTFGEVMVLYITVAGILILGEKKEGGS